MFRKSPQYQHVEGIGKTLEWYVAEWFRLSLRAPARHGVHIPGIADGGDLDVVAFVNGLKIFIECKSGNPANITESQLELFLRRTADFHPNIALLLIDTDQKVVKQEEMLHKVYLHSEIVGPESSIGGRWITNCIHVRNIEKSIDNSLRATLQSHTSNSNVDRPLLRIKTKEQGQKEAAIHTKNNHWAKTFAVYEQITRLDPNDATAYEKKGDALSKLKRFEEALIAYEQVTHLDPNKVRVYQKKGDVLRELERFEEALVAYEKFNQLAHNNHFFLEDDELAWAYICKGDALFNLERYEEALAAYDEGIQAYPHSFYYYIKGAALSELSRYEEALVAFDEAIGADANNPYAYEGKADALFHLKRYEEALVAYKEAISFHDNTNLVGVIIGKGNTLFSLERYKEALAVYKEALVEYEQNYEKIIYYGYNVDLVSIYNGMGDAFQYIGKLEEAQRSYERAKQLTKQLSRKKKTHDN
jgi:tetratricopeptide (TPR) repeat protein